MSRDQCHSTCRYFSCVDFDVGSMSFYKLGAQTHKHIFGDVCG